MSLRSTILAMVLLVGSATLVFYLFQRQLASAPLALGTPPEVREQLEGSLAELKELAELDPSRKEELHRRFEERERMALRLRVLEHGRQDLVRRYQLILLGLIAASVAVAGIAWITASEEPATRRAAASSTQR